MKNNKKIVLAYLGLFLMTSIIGLSLMFIKIGLNYTNTLDLLAHRFSIAFIMIIFLWILRFIKIPKLDKNKIKSLLFLSISYPSLFFMFQAYGMEYSSVSEAGIIFSTSPIITLIFAQIFLKEKTTFLQKIGILLSVIGVLYIVLNKGYFSGNISNIKGVILLLLSITAFTIYIILGKKSGSKFTAIEITVWITFIACIAFNILSLATHLQAGTLNQFFTPFIHRDFVWSILYLGILSSVLTSFLTNYALPIVPASQMAVLNNLSPVLSILSGVLFLDEKLYRYHIIGGLFVVIGIVITLTASKRKKG